METFDFKYKLYSIMVFQGTQVIQIYMHPHAFLFYANMHYTHNLSPVRISRFSHTMKLYLQVLMIRLESDLAQVLLAACKGELGEVSLSWSPGSAMVVVMASQGYPGSYKKGSVIRNLDEAEHVAPAVKIFHAGTALDSDGNFIATGGRVLGITAKGKDIEEARDRAYQAVEEINWPEGFFRRDIGWRALRRRQLVANE